MLLYFVPAAARTAVRTVENSVPGHCRSGVQSNTIRLWGQNADALGRVLSVASPDRRV